MTNNTLPTHTIILHHPIILDGMLVASLYAAKTANGNYFAKGVAYFAPSEIKSATPIIQSELPEGVIEFWNAI